MKSGETRQVGSATILCNVHRGSFYASRDDKWMGSKMRPRISYSRTTYTVIWDDGRPTTYGVEGYANAVKLALASK